KIQPATLSRKYRSCVTAITVPLYCCKCCSNQSIDSASKWLVGSSNNKTSGSCNNNRHNATLLRSPPDKLAMSASGSGQRNASIARSSFASNSQALVASIISCNSPCLANSLSIASASSYTSGNPNFSLISSYS